MFLKKICTIVTSAHFGYLLYLSLPVVAADQILATFVIFQILALFVVCRGPSLLFIVLLFFPFAKFAVHAIFWLSYGDKNPCDFSDICCVCGLPLNYVSIVGPTLSEHDRTTFLKVLARRCTVTGRRFPFSLIGSYYVYD